MSVFKMKEGDYLHKIKGRFFEGEIIALHFISKFGKEIKFEGELAEK